MDRLDKAKRHAAASFRNPDSSSSQRSSTLNTTGGKTEARKTSADRKPITRILTLKYFNDADPNLVVGSTLIQRRSGKST